MGLQLMTISFSSKSWPRIVALSCLSVCICICVGCGNGDLASLKGDVTVDGKPATAGIALEFSPIEGGSPSYAVTDENGEFVAEFTHQRFGIQPGEHRVKLFPGGGTKTGRQKMPDPDAEVVNGRGDTSPVKCHASTFLK